MRLYVGHLKYDTRAGDLAELLRGHGITPLKIENPFKSTKGRLGFGFALVTVSSEDGARAIGALNGMSFRGRPLRVNRAGHRRTRPYRGHGYHYAVMTEDANGSSRA